MNIKRNTKGELLNELEGLRRRLTELDAAETERHRIEAALKHSNEKLELLFNLLPVGISVLDREKKVLKENLTLEKILCISRDGLAGGDYRNRKYLRPDGTEMSPDEFASSRVLGGESIVRHMETGVVKEDGDLIWLEVSAVAAPFEDWSTIIVTSDITERKRMEQELRASEENYRTLFEHNPDGVVILDPVTAQPIQFNDQVCRQLGYSREEFGRLTMADIEVNETVEETLTHIQRIIRAGRDDFETRHRTKDGDIRDIYVTAQLINAGQKPLFHCIWRDITEPKLEADALQRSEKRYRLISENAADVIWVMDPVTGLFTYVSPSVEKLRGYTAAEVMAQPSASALTPESLQLVTERLQTNLTLFLAQGKGTLSSTDQVDQPCKDGSIVNTEVTTTYLFNEHGEVEIVGVSRDITGRKRTEEALRRSEERFQLAMEATQDGLWDWDIPTNQVYYSPAYFKILGYQPDQLPPHVDTWTDLIHPEDRVRTLSVNTDCIENRCERFETEFRMLAHDGTWKWILGKGKAVARDDRGRALRLIGTHMDITERKQAEAALAQLTERLELAQESAGIGVWDWNIETGRLQWTSKMYDLFGLDRDRDTASFDTWRQALHPADRESAEARIMQVLQDRVTLFNEYRILMPEGEVHWIYAEGKGIYDRNGHALRMIGICTDITERKQAEESLRESEGRFRMLYETMAQGVVYYDANGRVISANPVAEHILGLSPGQIRVDVSAYRRWHTIHEDGSDFPVEAHPAMVALQTRQPVQNIVMGVFHEQDGSYVWVNINAVPQFRRGDDKPYQVYATFEDVSARKRNSDIMGARLRLLEFASTHTVKELLQAALDEAGALVFSPIGFFHFVDQDQSSLTLQAWSTRTRLEFCTAAGENSHYALSEAGVWADGARAGHPIIHNNYASLENKRGLPEGHAAVTRELVVPIIRGDHIVAIMGVGNKPHDYTATDLEIVTALADFSWDIIQQRKTNDELRASEEQYRRLINLLPSGVVVHSQGQIKLVNRAGNRIFGASEPGQLIGTALLERVHPDFREMVQERVRVSEQYHKEAELTEEKLLRIDNTSFDAEVAAISVNYSGRPSILAVFNEITERKQRERELHTIATLGAALRTAHNRAEMLPIIVDQMINLLDCESVAIEIVQVQTGEAIVEVANGAWASLVGLCQEYGTGLNGVISRTRSPFVTQDLSSEANLTHSGWGCEGIRSCAGVPLVAQGQLIGFIWMGRKTSIAANEVELLSAVADIAANAIHRATLHEQTQTDANELALAYDTTLEGWASALELRDEETEGHTRRVVMLTLELAKRMGVNEGELENIRRGALLHDIGKMGVPDVVLRKPGTFNEREWEIMRLHPGYALKLLKDIKYLTPALDIPYCHHEKWDGTGYPRGLKGDEIPFSARIFAVVDVWDALTSDRPYRPAWSKEAAVEYIRQQSDKHFDPKVVGQFLELMTQKEL